MVSEPGAKQQKHHRDHLVRRDAPALLLDAHQFGDQSFAALLPGDLQTTVQIAAHLDEAADQPQKAECIGEMRHRIGPGDEFRPVRRRQAQQFADHRKRQRPRITLHQVGGAARRKQFIGEAIGDGADVRLHVEHGAAAERLVDDVAQPRVVRLVHRQHVVGECRDQFRHPPGQAGERPALLAQREQRAVLQHPRRRLVGRGDPDPAYDREFRRDGWTDRAQLRDAGLRITKKRLAGEIEIHMLCHRAVPHCRFATRSRWCATVKPQGSHF